LLQALLGAHPRIAAPPEMHFVQRIARLRSYWGSLDDDDVLRRVITETVRPAVPWLDKCKFDPERIFTHMRSGERTYAAVLDAVLRDYTDRQGKARWSEKTPRQHPRPIWRFFPHAQIVHIVRDPRPTIASTMAKLGAFSDPVTAARAWRQFTVESILTGAQAGPARYLRVRYEDLSRTPEAVMRLVFCFLGEDYDPAAVTDAERRRGAIPEGSGSLLEPVLEPIRPADDTSWQEMWRSALSSTQRARVEAVVGSTCAPLGYPPPGRGTSYLGHAANALHLPTDQIRVRRQNRAMRKMTPEMRYQFTLREQVDRVQRGIDRRAAADASHD
jgi:hypothetical protein